MATFRKNIYMKLLPATEEYVLLKVHLFLRLNSCRKIIYSSNLFASTKNNFLYQPKNY